MIEEAFDNTLEESATLESSTLESSTLESEAGETSEELHETEAEETQVSDTQVSETQEPDTGIADTGIADTSIADTSIADTHINLSSKEENLKALRESRRKLKEERDGYLRRLQEIERNQSMAKQAESSVDDDYDYDPHKKDIQTLKRQYAEMAQANEKMRLYAEIPDFSKIVTDESIAILYQRFPELAATLNSGTSTYSTGKSVYNVIKKFGLYVDEEQELKKAVVRKNFSKPRASTTIKTTSALANVGNYTELNDKEKRAEIIRIATERANG